MKEYVVDAESAGLWLDFKAYYEAHPAVLSVEAGQFLAWTRTTRHATMAPPARALYESAVGSVLSSPPPDESIIQRFVDLDYASQIGGIVDSVIEGKGGKTLGDIGPLLSEYGSARSVGSSDVVSSDLDELLRDTIKAGGVEWRLEDLNRSVGPLRRGDFVLVGKRPEVGGTSFICSELTYMAPQLPSSTNAIIFNNEEVGKKVGLRLFETALGKTAFELGAKPAASKAAYAKLMGDHTIDVVDKPGMTAGYAEARLRSGNYGIIVFNTLAKIQGFGKLEGQDRLEAQGQWARKLAAQYGVVFAVHQADNTAEGVEYLDQSQLYGSKTALQGETDVQLMIGKNHNPAKGDIRYISVVRNKIPGGPRTDPTMKYYRGEVGFDWQTGRFRSLSFK